MCTQLARVTHCCRSMMSIDESWHVAKLQNNNVCYLELIPFIDAIKWEMLEYKSDG